VLKNRTEISNKVVHALSRRESFLTSMSIKMVGLEVINNLYEIDPDFVEAWKVNKDP
jgi:hypothetical protein